MTETGSPGDFQRSTRMPLDAVVRLHFEGTVAYQNGFAANVSASGMFVKHPEPPPVGTRLVFEFGIGSQRRPVQGTGEVVWTREKYEGPGRPAGAGIRFAELDELSRQHLAEALFEFLEASLGDRVAEHPEVASLVSSVPTHAPPDFEVPEPAEPAAGGGELLSDISEAAPDAAGDYTPFRIFDEEPGPYRPQQDLGTVRFEIPGSEASAAGPAVRTAPEPRAEPDSYAGVAVAPEARRSRWPLIAGLAALLIAAAGFAGWWLYLREAPRLEGEAPTPPAAASAPAPAESPVPLDPEPGPGTTLAESVGAQREAPDAALPTAAPEAAAPAAPPTEPVTTATSRVTRLQAIRVLATGSGTEVTLSGDGFFPEGSFSWSEIGGEKPRVLIRLKGIEEPYRGGVATVPTDEIANVRTGYHQQAGGNELHVVLDLASARRVTVESVEPVGTGLAIRLARR
ncbi:MAG TPA: PilZ domain-containing protein [Thermoanaerobaculia bacterium]|nr:PilZ domain-containing protein [Thermoanaerobaculia bacterium]